MISGGETILYVLVVHLLLAAGQWKFHLPSNDLVYRTPTFSFTSTTTWKSCNSLSSRIVGDLPALVPPSLEGSRSCQGGRSSDRPGNLSRIELEFHRNLECSPRNRKCPLYSPTQNCRWSWHAQPQEAQHHQLPGSRMASSLPTSSSPRTSRQGALGRPLPSCACLAPPRKPLESMNAALVPGTRSSPLWQRWSWRTGRRGTCAARRAPRRWRHGAPPWWWRRAPTPSWGVELCRARPRPPGWMTRGNNWAKESDTVWRSPATWLCGTWAS